MRVSVAVVLLLSLLLVLTLSSCGKQTAVPTPTGPMAESPAPPPPAEPATTAAETPGAASEPAPEPKAIVEQVGAPLYEGAEAKGAEVKEGNTVATYLAAASYKDVKAFYLKKLTAPDWTNNGMEMGAMGGDEWEFTSADKTKLLLVKSESSSAKTEIRFTVKGK